MKKPEVCLWKGVSITLTPIYMPASLCAKEKEEKKQIKIKIFTKNGELRGKLQNRLSGKRGQLSKVEATHQDDLWEEAWQLASHCEVSGRRVI